MQQISLLWTGGWDSTFRLLQALQAGAIVDPHYVIDLRRDGFTWELKAMERIRALIARRSMGDIRPLRIVLSEHIPPDPSVTAMQVAMRNESWLGDQYDYLCRYAMWRDMRLELAIHRDDKAHGFIQPHVCRVRDGYRLINEPADPRVNLFAAFDFPLLDWTKLQMQAAAAAGGFADILEETCFCHHPDSRGRPCGNCSTCRYTTQEGLGRRIPFQNHVKRHVRDAVKSILRKLGVRSLTPKPPACHSSTAPGRA